MTTPQPDPFQIVGLGRTSRARLAEANITTLQQLIDTPAEKIALIVKQNITIVIYWQKTAKEKQNRIQL